MEGSLKKKTTGITQKKVKRYFILNFNIAKLSIYHGGGGFFD